MAKYALTLLMALFVALAAGEMRAADAAADPAARQIEQFYAALIDTMKNGRELGIQGRYRQLAPVAEDTFDLGAMTRLTVGPAWSTMSETDHKAITDAFGRLMLSNYAKNFKSFGGEQFVVDPMAKMRNEDKIVEFEIGAFRPFHSAVQLSDALGGRQMEDHRRLPQRLCQPGGAPPGGFFLHRRGFRSIGLGQEDRRTRCQADGGGKLIRLPRFQERGQEDEDRQGPGERDHQQFAHARGSWVPRQP